MADHERAELMGFFRKTARVAGVLTVGAPLAHKRSKKDHIVRNTARTAQAMEQMAAQTPVGPPPIDPGFVDYDAWAAVQQPQTAPPPPPPSIAGELERLASLYQQGALSADEFEVAKTRLLG